MRRTSGSIHSRSAPPGRNSPRRIVPASSSRSSASSTTPTGRPQRRAGSGVRNGPWVRAKRASSPSSAAVARAEERVRDAGRRRDAHPVAVSRDVLDRDPALLAADPRRHRPARRDELGQPGVARRAPRPRPGRPSRRPRDRRAAGAGRGAGRRSSPGGRRSAPGGSARGPPAPPGRAARAAPPGRAARAGGRDRASARPPAARPGAHRRRTCKRRRSRTGASSRTGSPGRLDAVDRDLPARDPAENLPQRRQVEDVRQAPRGTSRPGSGSCHTARRPRAGRRLAGAAARAASACRAGAAAAAAPDAAFSRKRDANSAR